MIEKQYLTTKEAADYFRVHPITILRWIEAKKIKALRAGPKSFRIPQSAINQFIHKNTK